MIVDAALFQFVQSLTVAHEDLPDERKRFNSARDFHSGYLAVKRGLMDDRFHRKITEDIAEVLCGIIDPRTGLPCQNEYELIWAIAPSASLSDALSTAFIVMTKDEILEFCETQKDIRPVFL